MAEAAEQAPVGMIAECYGLPTRPAGFSTIGREAKSSVDSEDRAKEKPEN